MVYGTHRKYRDEHGSSYAERTFRDLDLCVEQTRRDLEPHKHKFTSIVVTGISGLSVGAPVALALKKPLVVVRKRSPDDVCGGG
jgi:adenine/guanine phosphoribosyltransferase-like PRPP-binding protein